MASRSSRHSSGGRKEHDGSLMTSGSKKSKGSKDVDWSDITDPDERRRIQNRIAQRKFREKARENKERAERDSQNMEHAGNSYRIPTADEMMPNEQVLSGLPWGGVDFGAVLSRSPRTGSRHSSGRGTYVGDDAYSVSGGPRGYSVPLGDVDLDVRYSSAAPMVGNAGLSGGTGGAGLFYGHAMNQAAGYASSGGDDGYYDDAYPTMRAYGAR